MNKITTILALLLIISGGILWQGCTKLATEDQFYEYKVPDKQLKTIQGFDPNEAAQPSQSPAAPQEPNLSPPPTEMTISLEQCRALTLQNNLDLQAQLISPAIAAASLNAEEAKFESSFYAGTGFNRADIPGGTVTPVGNTLITTITSSQYESYDSNMGVRMPLRTGGTLDFKLADTQTDVLNSLLPLYPWYESNFAFSLSQPLLKNAGNRVNMYSIRLKQYEKQITDNATKLEVIRVLASADRAYWQLYAARKDLEVRRQQYQLGQAQLERAKRLVTAGQQSQVEILRAEAGLSRQLADIITSENQLRNQQRLFKQVINKPGLDIETPTTLIPATEADPVHYIFDPAALTTKAFENRAEFLELELRIAEGISTIDFYKNQMLPLVTLDYSYNVNGVGASRQDSFDMLNRKHYESHRVGVNLWVPLGNEEAKNNLLSALYQKRQLLANKKSRQQLVKQEVLDAIDKVESTWQQILAGRQNALLQGRLLEAEIRQFELGLRTSTDVLQAQTLLADAQTAEIRALTEYQISLVDLAYATGTLLGADKILWEPIIPPTLN